MASSTVSLILNGSDQGASAALGGVQDELGGLGGGLAGLAGPVGVAAGGLAVVGTAAVGAGAALLSASEESKTALNQLQAQTGATADEMANYESVAKSVFAGNFGICWRLEFYCTTFTPRQD